ncbi:MAG: ATP-binding protein, partial [Anaerolineae bacterium]|nr:ATP-binding protein [Anaerolineae bacterium]
LGEVPPAILEKMEIVSQKTQMITRLVEDIISLQKMEAVTLQLRTVTPHELVTRARHGAVANAAQLGIEITSDSTPNLPKLSVDDDRIGQVFDNLVANALKFSPSGTKIHISAEQDGDTIKFSIHDQGIGIPSHKMDKVFERFYQVDGSTTRRYSGAGLGLAIIKQIIELHNGRITVDSVVNQGTTFSFWLPIHKE